MKNKNNKMLMDNKRKIASTISIVMVFSVSIALTLLASASTTADNLGVEDASGYKNTNVLVPVNITNVHSESIVGIEFKILYDHSVINLAEIQKGTLTSEWSNPSKTGAEGDYVIGIVGTLSKAITNGSTGSVVVLNFSAIGDPGETSGMSLANIRLVNTSWDETGTAPAKNGTFTILGGPTPTIVFDTGSPANPYPSISGTHNGTITPNQTITVQKLYTYPCAGTGGHSELVRIWNNSGLDAIATWNGYKGDWHNITFNETFVLYENETYNYTIRTGSYPQIIHAQNHTTLDGSLITCKEFIDANGKKYTDWIPAIRLWAGQENRK